MRKYLCGKADEVSVFRILRNTISNAETYDILQTITDVLIVMHEFPIKPFTLCLVSSCCQSTKTKTKKLIVVITS